MNSYQHGSAWAASQLHLWLSGELELAPQFAPMWQWCLARNLRDAAFGCVAFNQGWDSCIESEDSLRAFEDGDQTQDEHDARLESLWVPGCGKAWEGK